jgi:hypothetical protein
MERKDLQVSATTPTRTTRPHRARLLAGKFYRVHGRSQCCGAKNLCAGTQSPDLARASHRIGNAADNVTAANVAYDLCRAAIEAAMKCTAPRQRPAAQLERGYAFAPTMITSAPAANATDLAGEISIARAPGAGRGTGRGIAWHWACKPDHEMRATMRGHFDAIQIAGDRYGRCSHAGLRARVCVWCGIWSAGTHDRAGRDRAARRDDRRRHPGLDRPAGSGL